MNAYAIGNKLGNLKRTASSYRGARLHVIKKQDVRDTARFFLKAISFYFTAGFVTGITVTLLFL